MEDGYYWMRWPNGETEIVEIIHDMHNDALVQFCGTDEDDYFIDLMSQGCSFSTRIEIPAGARLRTRPLNLPGGGVNSPR